MDQTGVIKHIKNKLQVLEDAEEGLCMWAKKFTEKVKETVEEWIMEPIERKHTPKMMSQFVDQAAMYLVIKGDNLKDVVERIEKGTRELTDDKDEDHELFHETVQELSDRAAGGLNEKEKRIISYLETEVSLMRVAMTGLQLSTEKVEGKQGEIQNYCASVGRRTAEVEQKVSQLEETTYDMGAKLDEVQEDTADYKTSISSVKSDISESKKNVADLQAKLGSWDQSVSELSQKANTDRNHLASLEQTINQLNDKIQEVEGKLTEVKDGSEAELKAVEKQYEEVKQNHSVLCQLMDGKIKPLVHLRHLLNKGTNSRKDNVTKLEKVVSDTASLANRVNILEQKTHGLAAYPPSWNGSHHRGGSSGHRGQHHGTATTRGQNTRGQQPGTQSPSAPGSAATGTNGKSSQDSDKSECKQQ